MDSYMAPTEYETKVVKFRSEPASYLTMMTRFNGEEHPVLSESGYRGEYILFAVFEGYETKVSHDPRKIGRFLNDKPVEKAMVNLVHSINNDHGPYPTWDRVDDGDKIECGDVTAVYNK